MKQQYVIIKVYPELSVNQTISISVKVIKFFSFGEHNVTNSLV